MKRFLLAVLLSLGIGSAQAGVSCSLPFTITNGTLADATQVMANYNALVTCFTNAAASGANSDITSLNGLTTPITPGNGGTNVFIGGTSTGTGNAQSVATTTPNTFTLTQGYKVVFIAGATNSGAMTLNVHSTGAKNVYRMTPSAGPLPLNGLEVTANNIVEAVYDGTQYEITSVIPGTTGPYGPLTSISSAGTTDLGTVPSHNAQVTGSAAITALGSSASTTFPVYQLTFTGAATLTYNATSLITPGTANIVTANNDTATAVYLGSGNWQVLNYQKANGTAIVNPTPLCGASGFTASNASDTSISYAADSAVLINPTGNVPFFATSISGTINLTINNGFNRMDTGAQPTSAWLNIFLVSDGTTTAAIASLSATAPSGAFFSYRCRLGAIFSNASTKLSNYKIVGKRGQYVVAPATQTTTLPNMANGINGSTWSATAGTYVSVAVSGASNTCAPPTATEVFVVIRNDYKNGTFSNIAVAPNANYQGIINASGISSPVAGGTNSGTNWPIAITQGFLLESSNLFYMADAAGAALDCLGSIDKVNAN